MDLSDPINVPRLKSIRIHAKALAFIYRFIELNNYPPSIREIGAAVGETSPSQSQIVVRGLVERNWLRRAPRIPRGIMITDEGMAVLEHIAANDL